MSDAPPRRLTEAEIRRLPVPQEEANLLIPPSVLEKRVDDAIARTASLERELADARSALATSCAMCADALEFRQFLNDGLTAEAAVKRLRNPK